MLCEAGPLNLDLFLYTGVSINHLQYLQYSFRSCVYFAYGATQLEDFFSKTTYIFITLITLVTCILLADLY